MRFIILFLLATSSPLFGGFGPRSFSETPRTAVVAAYHPEIVALLEIIETHPEGKIEETLRFKGVTYYLGKFKSTPIVVFETGISIANAAMTTQMALDYFPINRLLFSGIAGGVNPELAKGDVTIPGKWAYHDESAYFNPDPVGEEYIVADYYKKGALFYEENRPEGMDVPDYENFGMIFPDEVAIIKEGMERPKPYAYFVAPEEELEIARNATADLEMINAHQEKAKLIIGGAGVTGSVFVDNALYRQWIRRVWTADVTEMESAAIAQVCEINEIPWLIVRGVSDLAGAQKGKNEENIFDKLASENAAKVLFSILGYSPEE